jgi:hypothetical protein
MPAFFHALAASLLLSRPRPQVAQMAVLLKEVDKLRTELALPLLPPTSDGRADDTEVCVGRGGASNALTILFFIAFPRSIGSPH